MMTFLYLFLEFFKIGLFAVGGGPATIPFLQDLARSDYGWVNPEELGVMVAIAESTPGPMAINCATYVGFVQAGFVGSLLTTLGIVLPSFVIILAISFALQQFQGVKEIQWAFKGIGAGVVALLIKSLWTMYKKSPKGWGAYVVMGASFLLTATTM